VRGPSGAFRGATGDGTFVAQGTGAALLASLSGEIELAG